MGVGRSDTSSLRAAASTDSVPQNQPSDGWQLMRYTKPVSLRATSMAFQTAPWLLPLVVGSTLYLGVMVPSLASAQELAPAAIGASPRPPPAAASGEPAGKISIEVSGDEPVMLWQQPMRGSDPGWSLLCTAPCVTVQDRQTKFQVRGGPGIPSTGSFVLSGRSNHFSVDVRAGNVTKRRVGLGLAIAAAPLTGVGVLLMAYGGLTGRSSGLSDRGHPTASGNLVIGGGVLIGVGIPLIIAGIALAIPNATRLQINDLAPLIWLGRRLASRFVLTPQGQLF